MNETLSDYPQGFQVEKFVQFEETSPMMPQTVRNGGTLEIPVFIREVERQTEGEGEAPHVELEYRYIPIRIPFKGDPTLDYADLLLRHYEEIRRFFYGDPLFQSEMRDDEKWEAHSLAVRIAFPRPDGRIVYKYSVYKIQEKLITLGVWDAAKEYLVANGLWDKLAVIGNVRSDNPYFAEHYPVIKAMLEQALPGVDIDAQLRECVMD